LGTKRGRVSEKEPEREKRTDRGRNWRGMLQADKMAVLYQRKGEEVRKSSDSVGEVIRAKRKGNLTT